jgi:hypothetical protein
MAAEAMKSYTGTRMLSSPFAAEKGFALLRAACVALLTSQKWNILPHEKAFESFASDSHRSSMNAPTAP